MVWTKTRTHAEPLFLKRMIDIPEAASMSGSEITAQHPPSRPRILVTRCRCAAETRHLGSPTKRGQSMLWFPSVCVSSVYTTLQSTSVYKHRI